MNRAARIAGVAAPSQVLCSMEMWRACVGGDESSDGGGDFVEFSGGSESGGPGFRSGGLAGLPLGKVALKGVAKAMELVQCLRA